jgi:hypothetical protein
VPWFPSRAACSSQISKLAGELNASAAKLDRLIDALPDYEMDPNVVAQRINEHSSRYTERAAAVAAVTEALGKYRQVKRAERSNGRPCSHRLLSCFPSSSCSREAS